MYLKSMLFVGIIFVFSTSHAITESHSKKIIELIEISGSIQTLSDSLHVFMGNQFIGAPACLKGDGSTHIAERINSEIIRNFLLKGLYEEYSQAYSEEELDQLIAFLKSPLGQKASETNYQILRRISDRSEDKLVEVISDAVKDYCPNWKATKED